MLRNRITCQPGSAYNCCCPGTLQEAQHQASTTLSMLTRFQGRFHAALLEESPVLASLVDFAAMLPAHSPLVDVSVALVNLCTTDSPALQQQVSHLEMCPECFEIRVCDKRCGACCSQCGIRCGAICMQHHAVHVCR